MGKFDSKTSLLPTWVQVLLGFFGFMFLLYFCETDTEYKVTEAKAYMACQDAVKKRLKSPSSADFPWLDFGHMELSEGHYRIRASFEAQNMMGVSIQNTFTCEAIYIGDEEWSIESLSIY